MRMIRVAGRLARSIGRLGFDVRGKRVVEVGTGWRVDLPIGLYLCGAESVDTYDLNRYLKPALVMTAVGQLRAQRQLVVEALAGVAEAADVERRLDALLRAPDVSSVLDIAGIVYHAPADATRIDRPAGSADLHLSFTVLQQIPYDTLVDLLREASRILAPGGLAWHQVDLSDQFARGDSSISRANFLRFSDAEWARLSDNRFGYHNRLRAVDYERVYREAGHEILDWVADIDERSRAELSNGFPLAERFRGLPVEMLATDTIRVISKPERGEV
jgi:SAM-dependent methyltransferase